MNKSTKLWIEFEERPGYKYLCPLSQLIKLLMNSEDKSGKDIKDVSGLLRTALKQLNQGE